jgi:hypothetical protein
MSPKPLLASLKFFGYYWLPVLIQTNDALEGTHW